MELELDPLAGVNEGEEAEFVLAAVGAGKPEPPAREPEEPSEAVDRIGGW